MYTDALVKRAILFAGSGMEEECEAEFNKAVEMKKDHADIYLQRGRVCCKNIVVGTGQLEAPSCSFSCLWMARMSSSFRKLQPT